MTARMLVRGPPRAGRPAGKTRHETASLVGQTGSSRSTPAAWAGRTPGSSTINQAREEAGRIGRAREAERGKGTARGGAAQRRTGKQEEEFFSPLSLHSVGGTASSAACEEAPPTARAAAVRPQPDGEAHQTSGERSPLQCSGGYDSVKYQLSSPRPRSSRPGSGARTAAGPAPGISSSNGGSKTTRRPNSGPAIRRRGRRVAEPTSPPEGLASVGPI